MSKQLVLITGATGHIGFRTLVEVLEAGYRARVTTRKITQAQKIKAAKSIQPYLNDVEFLEIPDITAEGAFDTALKDVDFVLHLASPIPDPAAAPDFDVKKVYLDPAVNGTTSILESAKKSPSVKRVIITSSVVILTPQPGEPKVTAENVATAPDPDKVEANQWIAYRASKILAYHAAQDWVKQNNPSWDLIYILPAYVQGRNELVTDKKSVGNGSNDVMIDFITGKEGERPRFSTLVWVDDVARLEVAALDTTKGKNGDRYIAAYPENVTWSEVLPIAERLFPDALRSGILSRNGKQESIPAIYDSSTSTDEFGVTFEGLETMVKSLVGQYVELATAA